MSGVLAVVPYRGGCEYREAAWSWLRGWYALHSADLEVVEAEGPEPWCKATAVTPAVEASDAEIVAIADADVFCDALPQAIEAVREGAPWAIPHSWVLRLTREGTRNVLNGSSWEGQELIQPPYRGTLGGGIVVMRREAYLDCPLDPRFVGWGQEDESWGMALTTVLGNRWRGRRPLIHLYHPPQGRATRRWGSLAGRALFRRYERARDDPEQMRRLIAEVSQ